MQRKFPIIRQCQRKRYARIHIGFLFIWHTFLPKVYEIIKYRTNTLMSTQERSESNHKKEMSAAPPEMSLLQELKNATSTSAAIITAAQDLSSMSLSSTHPTLPSTFCLLPSCENHNTQCSNSSNRVNICSIRCVFKEKLILI